MRNALWLERHGHLLESSGLRRRARGESMGSEPSQGIVVLKNIAVCCACTCREIGRQSWSQCSKEIRADCRLVMYRTVRTKLIPVLHSRLSVHINENETCARSCRSYLHVVAACHFHPNVGSHSSVLLLGARNSSPTCFVRWLRSKQSESANVLVAGRLLQN